MARQDALLRLHRRLVEQRDELKRKLQSELEVVGEHCGPGDLADQSTVDNDQDVGSQLAALESRELIRIEKALEALKKGTYGTCEHCEKPIPITRLKALPHTSSCVRCQKNQELTGPSGVDEMHWESAWEHEARERDFEITVHDVKFENN